MAEEGWTTKESKGKQRKQHNQQNGSQIQANDDVEESWGVFVVSSDGQVLLLEHYSSFWSFCKGHKKKDDISCVATAIRELKEESSLVVRKLWKKTETWEEYCATERNDLKKDPDAFRTFVEEYSYYTEGGVEVTKSVTFFVAQVPPSEVVVDQREITGYMWVNLRATRDEVKELTTIPDSTRGENGMYPEDLDLFEAIQQVIPE